MTKPQKKMFKKLAKRRHKLAFIDDLLVQQTDLGGFPMWPRAYRKVCRKKGITCPLDASEILEAAE